MDFNNQQKKIIIIKHINVKTATEKNSGSEKKNYISITDRCLSYLSDRSCFFLYSQTSIKKLYSIFSSPFINLIFIFFSFLFSKHNNCGNILL